jgi:hypothetical protein
VIYSDLSPSNLQIWKSLHGMGNFVSVHQRILRNAINNPPTTAPVSNDHL